MSIFPFQVSLNIALINRVYRSCKHTFALIKFRLSFRIEVSKRFESLDKAGRLVMRRSEGQHTDDDQHAEDVPPHADVVQQRDQPDAELVQQAVHEQDDRVNHDRDPVRRAQVEHQGEQRVDEERGAEVDARGHRHLAEEVEPAGEP